jgi:hypothetical protein
MHAQAMSQWQHGTCPAGNNCLSQLTATSYLVRFTNLQLLNMAGNPLCQDPEYRSYVLSHLKHLQYLDYRCAGWGWLKGCLRSLLWRQWQLPVHGNHSL